MSAPVSSFFLPHCCSLSRCGGTLYHFTVRTVAQERGPFPDRTRTCSDNPVSHPTARGQAPCRGSPGSSYNVLSKEKGHYPLTSHGRSLNCSPDSSSSLTTVSCLMNALLILPECIYSFQVETSERPFSHENSVVPSTVCRSRPVSRFVFVFPWWLRW